MQVIEAGPSIHALEGEILCESHACEDLRQRAVPDDPSLAVRVLQDRGAVAFAPEPVRECGHLPVPFGKAIQRAGAGRLRSHDRGTLPDQLLQAAQDIQIHVVPLRQEEEPVAHAVGQNESVVANLEPFEDDLGIHNVVIVTGPG